MKKLVGEQDEKGLRITKYRQTIKMHKEHKLQKGSQYNDYAHVDLLN